MATFTIKFYDGEACPDPAVVDGGQKVKFVVPGGGNDWKVTFQGNTPFEGGKKEFRDGDDEGDIDKTAYDVDTDFEYEFQESRFAVERQRPLRPIITVRGTGGIRLTVEDVRELAEGVDELSRSLEVFRQKINKFLGG